MAISGERVCVCVWGGGGGGGEEESATGTHRA